MTLASRRCSVRAWLLGMGLLAALMVTFGGSARAQSARPEFKICKGQIYALCAAARCTVFDGVAYCQCEVKSGDSISLPFKSGEGEDVCSVNAAGANNRYMVSTYSLPASIVAPKGDHAIYTCSGDKSDGAYAQCDGGVCFTSTEERSFPGFDKPVPKGQIICSCPVTVAKPGDRSKAIKFWAPTLARNPSSDTARVPLPIQILAQRSSSAPRPARLQDLAMKLNGTVPALNVCRPPGGATAK